MLIREGPWEGWVTKSGGTSFTGLPHDSRVSRLPTQFFFVVRSIGSMVRLTEEFRSFSTDSRTSKIICNPPGSKSEFIKYAWFTSPDPGDSEATSSWVMRQQSSLVGDGGIEGLSEPTSLYQEFRRHGCKSGGCLTHPQKGSVAWVAFGIFCWLLHRPLRSR